MRSCFLGALVVSGDARAVPIRAGARSFPRVERVPTLARCRFDPSGRKTIATEEVFRRDEGVRLAFREVRCRIPRIETRFGTEKTTLRKESVRDVSEQDLQASDVAPFACLRSNKHPNAFRILAE